MIDNIYNTNIKNVLDENIISKKEISEFGSKIFKIKKPNDEEVTLASELLDRHNLIEYV